MSNTSFHFRNAEVDGEGPNGLPWSMVKWDKGEMWPLRGGIYK